MLDPNYIMISAYAKLPANITVEEVYKTMVVAVIVDTESEVIVDAEVSLVTEVSKKFVASMLTGYRMDKGPAELLERFDQTYFGHSKKALSTAINMIFSKYEEVKSRRRLNDVLQNG